MFHDTPTDARRSVRRLLLLAAVMLVALAAPAHGALTAYGPVVPAHGFPQWYQDETALSLELCLDGPPLCLEGPPDPLQPPFVGPSAEMSNFPHEAFWWAAEAALETANGGALLVLAQEAAFLGEEPVAGDQMAFSRVRIRADLPRAGTYTVTYPFGQRSFNVTAPGVRAINFTDDIGCAAAPCDFGQALTGEVGPFLRWDPTVAPLAPPGYIGDPAVEHRVVGSPTNDNLFRITGPGVRTGGSAVETVETNLFAVQGKLAGPPTALALIDPHELDFGSQRVGSESAARTVTLTNGGNASLALTGVSLAGADKDSFAIAGGSCTGGATVTLDPGESCTAGVRFAPGARRPFAARLEFSTDLPGSPHVVGLAGRGTAPVAAISPASLAFSPRQVGSRSAAKVVTVGNSGDAPLSVSGLSITGDNPGDFEVDADSTTCGAGEIAPGASCAAAVVFTPTERGARGASLRIATDAAGSPALVGLSGTGTAPAAAVDPASIDFGIQAVGTPGGARAVTVTNVGNAPLSVSSATTTGPQGDEFAVTRNDCAGGPVAPGSSCELQVRFTAGAAGPRSATLRIASDDPAGVKTVALTGEGATPIAVVSPAEIAYGSQRVGTGGPWETVTVTNAGTAPLAVSTTALDGAHAGDFEINAVANGCVNATVQPGAACHVSARFNPSARGDRSASLRISHNAAGSPHAVALSGKGIQSAAKLDPGSLDFGPHKPQTISDARSVTVTNSGDASLNVSGVALAGSNPGEYQVAHNGCAAPVEPGAACTIGVRFAPTSTGAKPAALRISDDAPGSPRDVPLAGSGENPSLAASPSSLAFGDQAFDKQSDERLVTVTNAGRVPLTLRQATILGRNAGDFAISSESCAAPAVIAPGQSCTIGVRFRPRWLFAREATLRIPSDDPTSPRDVRMTGNGTLL